MSWSRRFVALLIVALLWPTVASRTVAPLSAQGVNFRAPVVCDQLVIISGSSAATAELVGLTAAQRINVCGFVLTGAGATTVKLVRGTGTACGTGTADVTAAFELGDNTNVPFGGTVGTVARLPAGSALCWTNGQAVQVSGVLSYAKF